MGSGHVDQLTHRTHSPAARVSKAARAASVSDRAVSAARDVSCCSALWAHRVCARAHLYQMMSCEGSDWLLSQTFPEVIGGVITHSARDLYSELPPAPERKWLTCAI